MQKPLPTIPTAKKTKASSDLSLNYIFSCIVLHYALHYVTHVGYVQNRKYAFEAEASH